MRWFGLKVWPPLSGMFAEHLVFSCDILHLSLSETDNKRLPGERTLWLPVEANTIFIPATRLKVTTLLGKITLTFEGHTETRPLTQLVVLSTTTLPGMFTYISPL